MVICLQQPPEPHCVEIDLIALGGGTGGKAESDGTLPSSRMPQSTPPIQTTDSTPRVSTQTSTPRWNFDLQVLGAFNRFFFRRGFECPMTDRDSAVDRIGKRTSLRSDSKKLFCLFAAVRWIIRARSGGSTGLRPATLPRLCLGAPASLISSPNSCPFALTGCTVSVGHSSASSASRQNNGGEGTGTAGHQRVPAPPVNQGANA
jgi:hypothetical protein